MNKHNIRVATVFSGIGSPEQALKRLGVPVETIFACDNGERLIDVDLCVADGLPEPEYSQQLGFVTVSFKKKKEVEGEKIKQIITDKLSINDKIVDKLSISSGAIDKMVAIMLFLEEHPHSTTGMLMGITQQSASRTKNYVQALVEMDLLIAEGGNKNRTYVVK